MLNRTVEGYVDVPADYATECDDDGLDTGRGILAGLAISLPLWALIAAAFRALH